MSAAQKGTPGPWRAVSGKGFASVKGSECAIYLNVRTVEVDSCVERWQADAILIAAAPDLLEAARAAKRLLEPDLVEPGRTVFWGLVAAIAKAEGR